jgi:hypothetical protein
VTAPAAYDSTRRGLHAVAEHVLAAALHRSTGRIGLRATPGGFGTPVFEADGTDRQLRVEGVELVVTDGRTIRRAPLRTVREAAAFVGIEPGGPAKVYSLVTPLQPDVALDLDPRAAVVVHRLFAQTDAALVAFRQQHATAQPSVAQLWPEHFDLAMTMAEVNYGGSPGDDDHPEPYLYVGPWSVEGRDGGFWNEPFGASRSVTQIDSVEGARAFFDEGRRAAS